MSTPHSPGTLARRLRSTLSGRPRLTIALAVALFALILRALLPLALAWAIPWAVERGAGVRAELSNVDLGLLVGALAVDELRVALPEEEVAPEAPLDPDTALLRFERLELDLGWLDLFSGALRLERLAVSGLGGRLVEREDGALLLPLPPDPESPELEEPSADEGEPWDVIVERLEIDGVAFRLHAAAWGEDVVRFDCARLALDGFALTAAGLDVGDVDVGEPSLEIHREWLLERRARPAVAAAPSGETRTDAEGAARTAPETAAEQDATEETAEAVPEEATADPEAEETLAEETPAEPTTSADADEPPTEEAPGDAPPARTLALRRLAIDSADFLVRTERGDHRMGLHFEARGVTAAPGTRFPIELSLRFDAGRIELAGDTGLDPVVFEGRLTWSDLALRPFVAVAQPDLLPWLESGSLSGALDVSLRAAGEDAGLDARGEAGIALLSIRDPEAGELALAWQSLDVTLRELSLPLGGAAAPRLAVARISLDGPEVVATRPFDAVDRLLAALGAQPADAPDAAAEADAAAADESAPPSEPPEVASPPPASPGLRYAVDALEVRGGSLRLVDRSVEPVHETTVADLGVQVSGVRSPPPTLQSLALEGRIQQTGRLTIEGSLAEGSGEARLELQRLDLTPYDPFARPAGWRIDRGRASLQSTIRIEGDVRGARNELVLHQLSVQSQQPGTFAAGFGVSLDLALALLRDGEGDIRLSVPVSWEGSTLGVGVGSVMADALRQAIRGAVTSPLRAVGAVIPGRDASPAEPIAMAPGSTEIDPESLERLGLAAELLVERPALALALRGHWTDDDLEPLARALLTERAVAGGDFPDLEDAGFFARRRVAEALQERSRGRPGELEPEDEALLERYVAALPVPEARRRALAEARASAVREALLAAGAPPPAMSLDEPQASDTPGVSLVLGRREPPAGEATAENEAS